jgi:hypothetical protein
MIYEECQRIPGTDSVKRGLNGDAYCGSAPVKQTDPTGEILKMNMF